MLLMCHRELNIVGVMNEGVIFIIFFKMEYDRRYNHNRESNYKKNHLENKSRWTEFRKKIIKIIEDNENNENEYKEKNRFETDFRHSIY